MGFERSKTQIPPMALGGELVALLDEYVRSEGLPGGGGVWLGYRSGTAFSALLCPPPVGSRGAVGWPVSGQELWSTSRRAS